MARTWLPLSVDKTVKLIDMQTLEVLKVYQTDRPANAVALSPIFDQVCSHLICTNDTPAHPNHDTPYSHSAMHIAIENWTACQLAGVASLQVLIGGGQDAADVTTTSDRAGGFQSRFFHKVSPVRHVVLPLSSDDDAQPIWGYCMACTSCALEKGVVKTPCSAGLSRL